MELLECIAEQIASNRLPLVGITVAAVGCPDTPVILTLHWHGFVQERRSESDEEATLTLSPIPSTSLQINDRWNEVGELEVATMEAGWELGAWDVVRAERPACMRPGASGREAIECLNAFGQCALPYQGNELVVSEAPDVDELIKLAAQAGYLCWQFRPVFGGLWSETRDDTTLGPDGKRDPRCPLRPAPTHGASSAQRTVYTFGAATRPSSEGV
jgi:hypothetical protein